MSNTESYFMYLIAKTNNRNHLTGLRGLGQPRDTSARQRSLDAILKALQLNPVGGYVKGSSARKQLEESFESVPVTSALEVHNQLKNGEGSLGRLFQYRLHDATKVVMLNILWLKHIEQQKQLKEAQEVLQKVCEDQKKMIERGRIVLRDVEKSVERVCKLSGEDSNTCQEARFKLLEAKTRFEDTLRTHAVRCP